MSVRVASRVAERLETYDLCKIENLKKIPEMLGFDSEHPAGQPKIKLRRFLVKNFVYSFLSKIAVSLSTIKIKKV